MSALRPLIGWLAGWLAGSRLTTDRLGQGSRPLPSVSWMNDARSDSANWRYFHPESVRIADTAVELLLVCQRPSGPARRGAANPNAAMGGRCKRSRNVHDGRRSLGDARLGFRLERPTQGGFVIGSLTVESGVSCIVTGASFQGWSAVPHTTLTLRSTAGVS